MRSAVLTVAAVAGLGYLAGGVWAMVAPRSFFDVIATYPPYNQHLLHDIGAFLIGVGIGTLAGVWSRNALITGLAGVTAASVVHAVSHLVDADLGGHDSDPWLMAALAVVLLAATAAAVATRSRAARSPR
jgi:hypothetical protein